MKRPSIKSFYLLLIGTFFFAAGVAKSAQGPQPSKEMREVRVGVAVTQDFKKNDRQWKEKFNKRLSYASKIFETEFKIRFVPVYYKDWIPQQPDRQETDYLMEDLVSNFPLGDADLVIGLARLGEVTNPTALNDFDALGRARPFSGYLVLRYPPKSLFKIQEETVLVHELGHIFGAMHSGMKNSIMAPYVGRQIPSTFDQENRGIINLTRLIDFKKGIEALDSGVTQQLLGSYLKFANENQPYFFYYSLGVFYLKLNQPEEAVKAWKAAIGQEPEDPRTHYDLGMLYAHMEQPDLALRELSKAIGGFNMPSQNANKATAYNVMGAIYFQNGNTAGAYHVWSKAAVLMPDDLTVKANLALVKMRWGQFEPAADEFGRLLKREPNNVKILSNLGQIYYAKGDYGQAIRYFRQALQAKPDAASQVRMAGMFGDDRPSEIYNSMGSAYMMQKQYPDAVKCFQASCQANPNLECHKKLGMIYYQMDKWDECISELAGVIQVEKNNADLYGIIGVAFSRKGDIQHAVSVFNEGLTHAPDKAAEAALHRNLGTLYFNAKQADLAISEFQQAAAKNWKDAEAHFGLALAYYAMNRLMDARQSVKVSLQADPKMKKSQDLLVMIDKALDNSVNTMNTAM